MAQNPDAKSNPLKYAVEHMMKVKSHMLSGNSDKEFMENSIFLQDMFGEVEFIIDKIKKHESNNNEDQ